MKPIDPETNHASFVVVLLNPYDRNYSAVLMVIWKNSTFCLEIFGAIPGVEYLPSACEQVIVNATFVDF